MIVYGKCVLIEKIAEYFPNKSNHCFIDNSQRWTTQLNTWVQLNLWIRLHGNVVPHISFIKRSPGLIKGVLTQPTVTNTRQHTHNKQ